jgi:N-acetylneuraminic acid mutarotase
MKVEGKEKMMRKLTANQFRIFYDTHHFPAPYQMLSYPRMQWLDIMWTKVPDLRKPRAFLGAAVSQVPGITGPVIYAIGGLTNIDSLSPQFDYHGTLLTERYSRQTGIWEEMALMNLPREGLVAVAAGGKIYAVGGDWRGHAKIGSNWYEWTSGSVEEYDPAANKWTIKKNLMPHPVQSFGAAATSDGKIWVIGGMGPDSAVVGYVQCYDTLTGNWERFAPKGKFTPQGLDWGLSAVLKPMPTPRYSLAVVAGSNGKIYAIGGVDQQGQDRSTVEEFDPATNEWTPKKDMLTPRYCLAAVAASNGKIYAMGGAHSMSALSIVEEYDPSTDTWRPMNPMNTARWLFGAAATDEGKIYAIGGTSDSPWLMDSALASVEVMTVPYGPVHTGNQSSSSGSVNLTHGTNVLVVVDVAYRHDSMGDPTVTVGGAAATRVGVGTDEHGIVACASYVCFRSAAGTDSVAAFFSGSGTWCMTVQGITGTPKSGPFTETVMTGGASTGTSIALNVDAGSAGRRVHMAVCVNYDGPTTPNAGQTEVDDYPVPGDGRSVESNYMDVNGAVTMGASWSSAVRNAGIAYGILRSS